ncbi:GNAT family N-acetyltransferase [Actinacidiphila oryziradicis]|jgi:GNAT superfamily N-acetyltransferase|uniref:GNAT family N-acetyltransferase n=1 Tax=Actinacidiphila oryziradicis TaxID=2571141 RepID=UPI0023F0D0BB|nr:GNAT family N-acetyltransferase [Actinacidiphila oryziradicis]MCW2870752.1 acetyltransferase [Actinacidiphila oryziradicis]
MPHLTSTNTTSRHHRWRRDVIELAALFTAVATADMVANLVAHGPDGPALLVASAVALIATAGFHTWWARRHSHSPPDTGSEAAPGTGPAQESAGAQGGSALWRLRTTVRDTPGSLAALCTALAGHSIDILTLQTHPLADGTVDEFLLRVPAALAGGTLTRAVAAAGGRDTWLERADAHDLVDTPTRMLTLATRTAMDAAELPLALRQLFGRCTIRSVPAAHSGSPAPEDVLEGTTMRLRDPSGGTITVERAHLPFTPTEFARARALIELDAQLGVRMPDSKDVLTLPEGNEITIRRAGPQDLPAARAMHERCSPATLSRRYHGPVGDADRYLVHLLSPRFGQTLAVETASGRLVALAHLLWDGEENEVAVVVEDTWQRRGIGAELLRKLVALATEAGRDSVYAVTQATNTGMVATMRTLGLPLDYQVEDGTLVITATVSSAGVAAPASGT